MGASRRGIFLFIAPSESPKNLIPRKAKSVFTFSAKYDIIRHNKCWDFARRHSLSKHLLANLLKGRDAKFKCLTRIFPV